MVMARWLTAPPLAPETGHCRWPMCVAPLQAAAAPPLAAPAASGMRPQPGLVHPLRQLLAWTLWHALSVVLCSWLLAKAVLLPPSKRALLDWGLGPPLSSRRPRRGLSGASAAGTLGCAARDSLRNPRPRAHSAVLPSPAPRAGRRQRRRPCGCAAAEGPGPPPSKAAG